MVCIDFHLRHTNVKFTHAFVSVLFILRYLHSARVQPGILPCIVLGTHPLTLFSDNARHQYKHKCTEVSSSLQSWLQACRHFALFVKLLTTDGLLVIGRAKIGGYRHFPALLPTVTDGLPREVTEVLWVLSNLKVPEEVCMRWTNWKPNVCERRPI